MSAEPPRLIHKFPLPFGTTTTIDRVVRTLHVGEQGGIVTLWAEISDEPPFLWRPRVYSIAVTGERITDPRAVPVGTVQIGAYVLHVYEVIA